MDQTPEQQNTTENRLRRGIGLTLSAAEKTAMKNYLLDKAKTETVSNNASLTSKVKISPFTIWLQQGAWAMAGLILIFTGTTVASTYSQPGDYLYSVKVNIYEEAVALTKFTTEDQIDYNLELMESRLLELQYLADSEYIVTDEILTQVHNEIEELTDDSFNTLAQSSDINDPSPEVSIDYLSDLTSLAKAQEIVVDNDDTLTPIKERMAKTRKNTNKNLEIAVNSFIEKSGTSTAADYLSESLTEVSQNIMNISPTTDSFVETEQSIHDAEEALVDGELSEAIISVLEAKQSINIGEYLDKKSASAEKISTSTE